MSVQRPGEPGSDRRSYRPGSWFAVIGRRVVVLLPATEKARVAALWELVDGGDEEFDVVLDALIATGLRELPGFVLVSGGQRLTGGETKVVLRGAARIELEAGGETLSLDGASATTWVERSFAATTRVRVELGGDDPLTDDLPGTDGPSYVVDTGLVRVASLEIGTSAPAVDPLGIATEPDGVLAADEAEAEPELERADPGEPEPPARSPEPPSWTPAPPGPVGPPPPPPVLAAVPPPPASPPVPAPEAPTEAFFGFGAPGPDEQPEPTDVDHDGETVTGAWQPPEEARPGIPGQEPAPDVTVPVARLVLATGETVDVDRAVVIGRAPSARRFTEGEQPRLVTVHSPHLEVSSTHVEVRPGSGADHGSAVVTDLGSTNGTLLVQPGLGPEELTPGVAVQLIPGALIDLGDGVTIQVTRP
ncbi:FHA domain-containing protein [Nocardioides flavescens]|uniref:FHA domain-containing protein n=1 Tax=Nocardioides flavescens TaxID=2691959 RepID=A0A6L7F1N6_9ACTN|nr:FHA domain-containing protein [Nocardioides flavescens]MXG90432.1 hypothetical protein [Nocardioides flavescens]